MVYHVLGNRLGTFRVAAQLFLPCHLQVNNANPGMITFKQLYLLCAKGCQRFTGFERPEFSARTGL